MSDTVIPAMKTFRNFDPKQPINLKTGASVEVSVTSASITIESSQRSIPAQDAYRPEGHLPPQDAGTYGPGAAYGRKAAPHHHHSLKPDKSFDLDALFRSQREPRMSRTEAYSRIEISIPGRSPTI